VDRLDWVVLSCLAASKPTLCGEAKQESVGYVLSKFDNDTLEKARKQADEETNRDGVTVVTQDDVSYPAGLLELEDPPFSLFIYGDVSSLQAPVSCLAMVGTRKASPQGMHVARSFAKEVATAGAAIVSGLAQGIDSSSHEGALDANGTTIAIIGSGLHHLLKSRMGSAFAIRIKEKGAIVSEFPHHFPAQRWSFPWRNRIIAALSKATLVVEAPEKSGALITARRAMELGRDVLACPGLPGMAGFAGCNRLIKDGAMLVDSSADLFEVLNLKPVQTTHNLTNDEKLIISECKSPVTVDELCHKVNLSAESVLAILTILDLKGLVKKLPGGTYMKSTM